MLHPDATGGRTCCNVSFFINSDGTNSVRDDVVQFFFRSISAKRKPSGTSFELITVCTRAPPALSSLSKADVAFFIRRRLILDAIRLLRAPGVSYDGIAIGLRLSDYWCGFGVLNCENLAS